MADFEHCPVCRRQHFGQEPLPNEGGNRTKIVCRHCGSYVIGRMAAVTLNGGPAANHALSAWIRHRDINGSDIPVLTKENLQQTLEWLPSYSVYERSIELLKALAILSKRPGGVYKGLYPADAALAWGEDEAELKFHLDTLASQRLIEVKTAGITQTYLASLTADGWRNVEVGPASVLQRAFVAMSFSEGMRPAWVEGLKPGIEAAGYSAHRVDSDRHIQRIDQKIVADIRTSRLVVVDVTEQKQGAYFEAGLALGFGKPVIWSVRRDDLPNVHFDTRQYAHIVWDDFEHLRQELRDVIVAVLGEGPEQKR